MWFLVVGKFHDGLGELLCGLDAACFFHADHFISDDLPPVTPVFVRLYDREGAVVFVEENCSEREREREREREITSTAALPWGLVF